MRIPVMQMMILLLALPVWIHAQSPLDYRAIDNARQLSFMQYSAFGRDYLSSAKWQLRPFAGLSGAYGFVNRTNPLFIAAPAGLQLTRQLSNNLYAVAAVSAAPTYFNFNRLFLTTGVNKFSSSGIMTTLNEFGWQLRAGGGLMYVNDQKTFSISGHVFIDRSSYPTYYPITPQRNFQQSR